MENESENHTTSEIEVTTDNSVACNVDSAKDVAVYQSQLPTPVESSDEVTETEVVDTGRPQYEEFPNTARLSPKPA